MVRRAESGFGLEANTGKTGESGGHEFKYNAFSIPVRAQCVSQYKNHARDKVIIADGHAVEWGSFYYLRAADRGS